MNAWDALKSFAPEDNQIPKWMDRGPDNNREPWGTARDPSSRSDCTGLSRGMCFSWHLGLAFLIPSKLGSSLLQAPVCMPTALILLAWATPSSRPLGTSSHVLALPRGLSQAPKSPGSKGSSAIGTWIRA